MHLAIVFLFAIFFKSPIPIFPLQRHSMPVVRNRVWNLYTNISVASMDLVRDKERAPTRLLSLSESHGWLQCLYLFEGVVDWVTQILNPQYA